MRTQASMMAILATAGVLGTEPAASLYDLSVKDAHGAPVPLRQYAGRVLLIVNVASKCGFTPQYKGLQALHEKYAGRGLVVLGFPCNQFGSQEPGTDADIQTFCSANYGVTFPVLAKIEVNGEHADPLYVLLRQQAPGALGSESIKWNFTKFLVDRQGRVVSRFASTTTPASLAEAIEKLLGPEAAATTPAGGDARPAVTAP